MVVVLTDDQLWTRRSGTVAVLTQQKVAVVVRLIWTTSDGIYVTRATTEVHLLLLLVLLGLLGLL